MMKRNGMSTMMKMMKMKMKMGEVVGRWGPMSMTDFHISVCQTRRVVGVEGSGGDGD